MHSIILHTMAAETAYNLAKRTIKGRLDGHYQHNGVRWMLARELTSKDGWRGGILADDMGLGKTMQAIATLRGNPCPTLIITIVGTVAQWRDALIDFGGFHPIIINPSFQGILPNDIDVAITTYSSFQSRRTPPCLSQPWGRIILDEGHTIRNPSTRVYKEISQLTTHIKWVLTGTPIQNSQRDLYTIAGWIGAPKATPIEIITDTMLLRRTQEQQEKIAPRLALPPLETQIVKVPFATEAERAFYSKVEKYFAKQAKNSVELMESFTRCRQACSHPQLYEEGINRKKAPPAKRRRLFKKAKKRVSSDDESDDTSTSTSALPPSARDFFTGEYPSSKINYLVHDLKQQPKTTKSLVFCHWTGEMRFIAQHLKEASISSLIYDGNLSRDNKEAVLYNFKHTSIPVLIIQITCGSAGLNLQCAQRVYITSPTWNPCIELQAIGRAYRKGQTSAVTCVRLVMSDTVEERCINVQDKKLNLISDAMMDESFCRRLWGNEEDAPPPQTPSLEKTISVKGATAKDSEFDIDIDKILEDVLGVLPGQVLPDSKPNDPYIFMSDADDDDNMPLI